MVVIKFAYIAVYDDAADLDWVPTRECVSFASTYADESPSDPARHNETS